MAGGSTLKTKSGFHPDPEHSYTLPAHYYYDREIETWEREAIWFKTWQLVGYTADLGSTGSFITETILDQPVFVVSGRDGDLRAYYNVCMHRGHILLEGKGDVRMITCPFHAWTYDLEGNLRAAGNSENVAGFDAGDFCLPEIGVEEFAGMVFVNLDAEAPSLASQAPGLAEDFSASVPHFDALTFVRRDPYTIEANWKFIPDQNECYHCPSLHPQAMGTKETYLQPSWETTDHGMWSKHVVRGNRAVKPENLPYGYSPDDAIQDVNIWFLFPNLIFITHQGPSNFKVTRIMPTGAETATQTIDNFCHNDPATDIDIGTMDNYRDVVIPQDVPAMEQQQLGVRARGYTQGRLMCDREVSWRSEHGTHFFYNLVWRALNGDRY